MLSGFLLLLAAPAIVEPHCGIGGHCHNNLEGKQPLMELFTS